MADGDEAAFQQFEHRVRQSQQTQDVGQRTAALAQLAGGLLLRQAAAVHQLADARRLFHRVEVFALEVLHQRQLHRLLVGHILDDDRHLSESRHPAGTPAALTGYDEVAAGGPGPHRDGLQQTMLRDAGRKLCQRLVIEGLAGLAGVRLDLPQG